MKEYERKVKSWLLILYKNLPSKNCIALPIFRIRFQNKVLRSSRSFNILALKKKFCVNLSNFQQISLFEYCFEKLKAEYTALTLRKSLKKASNWVFSCYQIQRFYLETWAANQRNQPTVKATHHPKPQIVTTTIIPIAPKVTLVPFVMNPWR